jgi:hypothetical protein
MSPRRALLLSLLVPFVLAFLPAAGHGQGDRGRFERNRERWERMSPRERAVMRERFEKMRRMSPEERRELFERASNLRSLEDGLRKAPPKELQERLRGKRREWDREAEVRRYLHDHSERFGRPVWNKLPTDLRSRLDATAAPEDRMRLMHEYFRDCRQQRGTRTERAIRLLDLPAAEKEELLALPAAEQEQRVLALTRRWIEARAEEKGLPPGISAEEWQRMQSLSDREFLARLRCADRLPEHLRGRSLFRHGHGFRGRDADRARGGTGRRGDGDEERGARDERPDPRDGRRRGNRRWGGDGRPPPPPRPGDGTAPPPSGGGGS